MPVASSVTPTRTTVEVFADVTCPFAHVGLRRFVARRAAFGIERPILNVRAWPLEFVNGELLERELVAQHVDELRNQVAPDLFQGFDPDVLPMSSMPAFKLVAAAYEVSDVTGERVSLQVRDALFEHGRDISDPDVLRELAVRAGIPAQSRSAEQIVLRDYEEGRRRGVRGSPEFFLDGRGWYCPSLHIENVDGTLRIEPDLEAVESFLTACFKERRRLAI
jgi:predicted DsbA family dithiol-disulfide isomerase